MPTALAQTTLVKQLYNHNAIKDYTKANFYAKLCNDLGLPHIGFMTRSYPPSCIENNTGIKVCLINVVLEAKCYAVELALVEYAGSASAYMLYTVILFVGELYNQSQ